MNGRVTKIALYVLLTFSCHHLDAQDATLDTLAVRLSALAKNRAPETVYLQTSKGIYETGEDLWFKACVLDAQTYALSTRSQTLYLQMISETDNKAVWQEKYPIENGIVAGHVYVNDSLPNGNYWLEACTPHSFYDDSTEITAIRKVKILQNINVRDSTTTVALYDSAFRFETFPESGNLIAGIPAKLAFKATDGRGYPVDIKGVLYQNGDSLLDFQSAHAGTGCLQFTPEINKSYQLRLDNGKAYPLPEIHSQGMILQLAERDSNFLEFVILQNSDRVKPFYLTGHLRGIVCCAAKGVVKHSQKVKIPLAEFPQQGIAVFTLYNENMLPVAERLVYVHPEKKLNITAKLEKKNYGTREKVTVRIKTTDENARPVTAHLGVSVFDPYYSNPEDPKNILTHCYLSSQIRGKIYDPAYYFDEKNADRTEALDLLLLTQGWRRYVWNADNLKPHGETVIIDGITGIPVFRIATP